MPGLPPDAESRFHAIFEGAGVAISIVDARGMMVECNHAMVKLFGYSAEEFQRLSFRDLTHPDDVVACEEKFSDLIRGSRSSYHMEKRFRRRDGQLIWGALTVSLVPNPQGRPEFAMGIVEDITERKRAEQALRSRREHLEASVRASNTGLWDWNLETDDVYFSPEWKSQLGYQDHEIAGRIEEWRTRLHPEDREAAIARVLAFLRNPWPNYEMECRLRHRDGSYRWILARGSLQQGPDGKPCRMLGSHLDITDRKRTEETLREYEKVVEGLPEMIAVVDRDYRFQIANRAYLSYRSLEQEQVLGRLLPDVVGNDEFGSLAKSKLDECFKGTVVQYEARLEHPRLGERQFLITHLPIEGPHGIDRVACVLEDTTERKRTETDLREAHRQLTAELKERISAEQRVRALSERLITAQEEERRNIARELHDDLSQEIAALSISVSNLNRSIPEPLDELRGQSDGIQQRIGRLAEGVRHLARQLHPAVLEYSGIAVALQSYGAEFGAVNRIRISIEAFGEFGDVPAPVGLCLYRVTQEALQNAVKHGNAATAAVRIERCPGFISLVIHDSGRGFPDVPASASRGLGLVSMSERVRLLDGTLDIRSAPRQGTTVSVSIPC